MKEADPNGIDAKSPGSKLDKNKVRVGLMLKGFSGALLEVAKVTTYGAKKYSDGGWQSVKDGIERYDDAKGRHLLEGYQCATDADSNLKHLAMEAWNALAKLELVLRKERTDD